LTDVHGDAIPDDFAAHAAAANAAASKPVRLRGVLEALTLVRERAWWNCLPI
jgi:hypothetical protein